MVATLSFGAEVVAQSAAPVTTAFPTTRSTAALIIEEFIVIQARPTLRPDFSQVVSTIQEIETRPKLRPENLVLVGAKPPNSAGRQCRNKALVGEPIADIPGKLRGCGVKNPVRLTAINDIQLSRAAIMNCETANAFAEWTEKVVVKEFKKKKRSVVSMDVMASYSCRTRNHQPGAKISEHGKGNAVDIGAFLLDNGKRVSVFVDWTSREWGRTMKRIHKGACGPFGTVLGPNSDRFHKDHFHMDTARHRNGPYCR
ncbi:MAG: extensin family protein [Pseudomonadota bacterium]